MTISIQEIEKQISENKCSTEDLKRYLQNKSSPFNFSVILSKVFSSWGTSEFEAFGKRYLFVLSNGMISNHGFLFQLEEIVEAKIYQNQEVLVKSFLEAIAKCLEEDLSKLTEKHQKEMAASLQIIEAKKAEIKALSQMHYSWEFLPSNSEGKAFCNASKTCEHCQNTKCLQLTPTSDNLYKFVCSWCHKDQFSFRPEYPESLSVPVPVSRPKYPKDFTERTPRVKDKVCFICAWQEPNYGRIGCTCNQGL